MKFWILSKAILNLKYTLCKWYFILTLFYFSILTNIQHRKVDETDHPNNEVTYVFGVSVYYRLILRPMTLFFRRNLKYLYCMKTNNYTVKEVVSHVEKIKIQFIKITVFSNYKCVTFTQFQVWRFY